MSDRNTRTDGSRERVAMDLLLLIRDDDHNIGSKKADILRLYAECLHVVSGGVVG